MMLERSLLLCHPWSEVAKEEPCEEKGELHKEREKGQRGDREGTSALNIFSVVSALFILKTELFVTNRWRTKIQHMSHGDSDFTMKRKINTFPWLGYR